MGGKMKLKNCPCCGKQQTTRTAEFKGRFSLGTDGLLFNCRECHSTFTHGLKVRATPKVEPVKETDNLSPMAQDIVKRLA
jgi:hypothetical protein